MSGENFGRANAQSGVGPGANDRYVYNGDGTGGATGVNGTNGANPADRYQYSGDGSRQPSGACSTSSDCNWRPDYSYSSPHARAWLAASKEQATHPIDRDANGLYTVQFGDSLSGLAARELRSEGQSGPLDKSQIKAEVDRIVQANDQQYASLDCNKDLVKVGWHLHIPRLSDGSQPSTPSTPAQADTGSQGDTGAQSATGERDGGDHRRPCPERGDQPDSGPRTTIYNIQNAYFYGNGIDGFSMSMPERQPRQMTDREQDRGQHDRGQYDRGQYDRGQYDGSYRVMMPNQGDQNYQYIPQQFNTSIPPAGLSNGYGWSRGACLSCGENGGVYFNQPQGWDYDSGYQPGVSFGLNILGGDRNRYNEHRNRNWQNNNNNWQYSRESYSGFNGDSGYSGQFNGNLGNEGYSIQTVPYNPNSGQYRARTLLYRPSSESYSVTPTTSSTINNNNSGYGYEYNTRM